MKAPYLFLCSLLFATPVSACELLGYSFNESVPAGAVFEAFRHRGESNRDGWGVAWYPDASVQVVKEAQPAPSSDLAEFLSHYKPFKSPVLVAHVRAASVGGAAYQNTHPFVRELAGREYALAHNGTLKDFRERLKLGRVQPLGVNDSEYLLCYLLGQIEARGTKAWDKASCEWLQDVLRQANDTGGLNVLLTDGQYLFAYHDKQSRNRLHYVVEKAPYGKVRFKDVRSPVDLGKVYPATAGGVIVATTPLTDEKWTAIEPGTLLVVKDGKVVFFTPPAVQAVSPGTTPTVSPQEPSAAPRDESWLSVLAMPASAVALWVGLSPILVRRLRRHPMP